MAERLRERIARELGFEVSCGVARSRAAAQIASRLSRPKGVLYTLPGYEARLLAPLDVGLLPDLPAGARQRLVMEGISTLGRLADVTPDRATALLGSRGPAFVRWARGEDDRPVDRLQPPRSIAREVTLTIHEPPSPLAATEADLHDVVRHLADVLAMRLRAMGWFARTVSLRLRPPAPPIVDGTTGPAGIGQTGLSVGPRPVMTRSVTLREATALGDDLRAAALSLLKVLWRRQPVGGIGLVVSNLQAAGPQMPLFPLSAPASSIHTRATPTAETLRARSGLRVLVDERCLGVGRRQFDRRVPRLTPSTSGGRHVVQPDIRRRTG